MSDKTQSSTAASGRSDFRGDIQGLRAIAVGGVVLYHAGVPFLPGGYVGVDVFFVISGFLITAHLLSSLRKHGRIRFAEFYAKRARRILPASFAVLAASVVAALIFYPPLLMQEVWRGALATAFYVPNLLFALQGTNYLAESTPSLFQHFWSLGIEEQFYLVWPALLGLSFGLTRSRRTLTALVVGVAAVSFAACIVLTYASQPWAFFSLPTRAWELAIGGLTALLLENRRQLSHHGASVVLAWSGLVGILGSFVLFTSGTPFPSFWAVIPVVSTAMVIAGGLGSPVGGPSRLLSTRGMLFIGAISYSLYLVHWPVLVIPQTVAGQREELPLGVTLGLAVLCVPLAYVSYRYVEAPGLRSRFLRNARPRRTLAAAAAASVLISVGSTGALVASNSRQLFVDTAAVNAITSPPTATAVVPRNLEPSLRQASMDQPAVYEDGCHRDFDSTVSDPCVFGNADLPRIALFGDSHAAQWFPAVFGAASELGYSVETFTKNSCPSVSVDVVQFGVPYTACSDWRDGVLEDLRESPPELVIIANYGRANIGFSGEQYFDAWEAGLEKTIQTISAPVIVMADTPNLVDTPSVCLSMRLDDAETCGLPREDALDEQARDAEASASLRTGATIVDMTDYLCTADWCPPIVGNTLIYRDAHHMTASFSAELAQPLAGQLDSLLE